MSSTHLLLQATEVLWLPVMHHAALLKQQIIGAVQKKVHGLWSQLYLYPNPSPTLFQLCEPEQATQHLLALASLSMRQR